MISILLCLLLVASSTAKTRKRVTEVCNADITTDCIKADKIGLLITDNSIKDNLKETPKKEDVVSESDDGIETWALILIIDAVVVVLAVVLIPTFVLVIYSYFSE